MKKRKGKKLNQFNQKNRFNHNAVIVGMVIAILIAAVIVLSIKSAGKITGTIVASDLK